MARARAHDDTPIDPTDELAPETKPEAPEPAVHGSDVLVYVRTGGPLAVHYNRKTRAGVGGIQQERVRLVPGLSTCPAQHWPMVKPALQPRVEAGEAKVIAGASGSLADNWAKVKPKALVEYLTHTHDVATLQRLHALENESPRPRLEVQDAISAALKRVDHLVADAQEARRFQRQRNRAVR